MKSFILALPLSLILAGCSAAAPEFTPATPTRTAPATSPRTASATSQAASSSAQSASAAEGCSYTKFGKPSKDVQSPQGAASTSGTAVVTLTTNQGDITVSMDRSKAPCTVHNFVSLAQQGYFTDTQCHRMVLMDGMKVLQCGDPTGTGSGSAGYRFDDELSGTERYTVGTVAMANSGPDTNSGQFFIVFGVDAGLAPHYTVFGTVDAASLAVVDKIAAKGLADGAQQDGKPADEARISAVKVK